MVPLEPIVMEGQITLQADQRAVFTVLTGTEFTIYETDGAEYHADFAATQQFGNSAKYPYTLTESETNADGALVSGTVGDLRNTDFGGSTKPEDGTNASMEVTLSNSTFDFGTSLEINKTLTGWTSGDYTFSFNVEEVSADGTAKNPGTAGALCG